MKGSWVAPAAFNI